MSERNKKIRRFNWLIICLAGLLLLDLFLISYFYFQKKNFRIIFLDVGQGDAILIITSSGKNILIDGGPDKRIIYKLDQYIPFYKRKIDLMILTHPDPDHLNGLVEVLKRYKVDQVFYNGVKDESLIYLEFLKIIEEKKIKKEIVYSEKNFIFQEGKENVQLEILYPIRDLTGKSFKNDNEASIVLKLIFGKIKILLTGDATKSVENELISYNPAKLEAEILKVSHHGAKDATSLEFLEKIKPNYAIISVGKNRFGHPSLRVLKNLEKIGAKILRTDQLGDIIFEINNHQLRLKTKK